MTLVRSPSQAGAASKTANAGLYLVLSPGAALLIHRLCLQNSVHSQNVPAWFQARRTFQAELSLPCAIILGTLLSPGAVPLVQVPQGAQSMKDKHTSGNQESKGAQSHNLILKAGFPQPVVAVLVAVCLAPDPREELLQHPEQGRESIRSIQLTAKPMRT